MKPQKVELLSFSYNLWNSFVIFVSDKNTCFIFFFCCSMMHGWEMMPPTTYENNWCGGNPLQIKSEPQDLHSYTTSSSNGQKPANHASGSNPTSPQSMDSIESSPQNTYYSDQIHSNMQTIHRTLGFNPLTPPGYPSAILPQTTHHQAQTTNLNHTVSPQQPNQTTPPFRHFSKSDSTYSNTNAPISSSLTPPIDDTPPKSPKYLNETPEKEMDQMSNSGDESRSMDSDDDDIRTPKVNSHGKVKTFKCKQCDFVAVTKMTFWDHTKAHIKPEKVLKCPKCPFVTEYKHHLEYHLRNHDGSKPFQCNKCNYSCVNKSMLNSHLKSHSNIYQYRCSDCSYATKYCHSLKLHLRKYNHKPAMVLNQDGSPNPLPIIDVYGTRRGPKTRTSNKNQDNKQSQQLHAQISQSPQQQLLQTQQQQQQQQPSQSQSQHQHQQHQLQSLLPAMLPNPFANMLHHGTNMSLFPYLNLNFQMFAAQQQAALASLSPNMDDSKSMIDEDDEIADDEDDQMPEPNNNENNIRIKLEDNIDNTLNVTPIKEQSSEGSESGEEKITTSTTNDEPDERYASKPMNSPLSSTPSMLTKNRRKGRAFKLDMLKESDSVVDDTITIQTDDDDQDEIPPPSKKLNLESSIEPSVNGGNIACNPQSPTSSSAIEKRPSDDHNSTTSSSSSRLQHFFECQYCEIAFKDAVLYTIHKGYHGYNDVFKCNMCGEKCDDRVSFFLHIARSSHS